MPYNRPLIPRRVNPRLVQANRLFAAGEYKKSAELFEELAQRAVARGGLRAPHLYLHAARARLFSEQMEASMELTQKGLELFEKQGRWNELRRIGNRVVTTLQERKCGTEAKIIAEWLENALADYGGISEPAIPERSTKKRPHLPLQCPSCGGPIHPKEVEWVDDVTAECNFCGNLVRGNEM